MAKLKSSDLRQKYLEFFKARGHVVIPPAPLVPENDPTTLFTSSGMQPLVPYLLGEKHPSGTRVVDSQPSVRMEDIEEVGDNRHTTFFEMLGNWSLGDYFKQEQLEWVWEFLTKEIGLDPKKLYVTVCIGDEENGIPKDEESVKIWEGIFEKEKMDAKYVELGSEQDGTRMGMQGGRIFAYDVNKNWWSRSGVPANMPAGEPGGPDSEVFYEFTEVEHDPAYGEHCHPNCDCGRFLEIGNSVFMEYVKQEDGSFKPLPAKNVDFGGGFERILAAINDDADVFKTDLFMPIIQVLEEMSGLSYARQPNVKKRYPEFSSGSDEVLNQVQNEDTRETLTSFRVIADHMKAAVMMIAQGLEPSNKQQGYVLRRLLRRAAVKLRKLGGGHSSPFEGEVRWGRDKMVEALVSAMIGIYEGVYLDKDKDLLRISEVIEKEFVKFEKTLEKGLKVLDKHDVNEIDGKVAFDLFQTYGFPFELTLELVEEKGGSLRRDKFDAEFAKHQEKSRSGAEGMFKGGLADHSENVVKYHTATHLLHASLRKVLGEHVQQKGSNITGERLRFDFSHDSKLSQADIKQIEEIINQQIQADLNVSYETMSYDRAIKEGALAFFGEKYPEKVKVYTIGPKGKVQAQSLEPSDGVQGQSPEPRSVFSKEICGGPHVEHTGEIGKIEVYKETSAGAGVRRIYARMKE